MEGTGVAIQFRFTRDLESAPLAAELGFHGYQKTWRNGLYRLPVSNLSLAVRNEEKCGKEERTRDGAVSHEERL